MRYQDVLKRFVSEQAQLLQEKQMKQQMQEQRLAASAQALGSFVPGQQQSPQEEYSETEHNPFEEGQEYRAGGIHIDPSKKGTFKAQATRMNMSIQEAASHILNNRERYSPGMVKKANFAKNFAKEEGGMFTGDYEYEDGGDTDKKKAVTVEKELSRTTETDKNSNQTRTTGLNATLDFKTKYGLKAGFDANLNSDRKDVLNITNQRLSFDNNFGKTGFGFKIENQSDENGNFDRANSDVSAYLRRRKLGLDASNHVEKNDEGLYTFSPTAGLTYGLADEEGKNLRLQGEFTKDENGEWKVVPTIDAGYKSGPLSFTSQQRYEQNSDGRYNSDLNADLEYNNGMFNAGLTGKYSKENYLENPSNKMGVGANIGYTGDKFGFGARANYDQNNRTLTDYDEEGNPINSIEKTSNLTGSANANANLPLSDAMMLKLAASNNFKEGDLVDPRLRVGLNYNVPGSRASFGVSNEFREGSLNNPSVNFRYAFEEGGDVENDSDIKCGNCGWSWKMSNAGNDPMTCHKCGGTSGKVEMRKGGEMIKRADGSYSQRGMWDNIRDNAGSGKKPTREMLDQKRRINNKYPDGGDVKSVVENTSGPRADESYLPMDYLSFINSDEYTGSMSTNEALMNPATGVMDKVYRQEGNPLSIDYIKSKLADKSIVKTPYNNLDPVHRYYDTELVNSSRDAYDTHKQSHLKQKVEGEVQNYPDMEDVIKGAHEHNLKNGYDDTDIITSHLGNQANKEGLDIYDFMAKYYGGSSPNAVARQLLVDYSKKMKK